MSRLGVVCDPVNRGDHMNEKNDQFINLRDKVPDSQFKFEGKSCRMKCKGSHDGGVMVVVVVVVAKGPNKSQHTKLIMEKEILPPLLPGFELATFRSRVRRSTNKLSRLPIKQPTMYLNLRPVVELWQVSSKLRPDGHLN